MAIVLGLMKLKFKFKWDYDCEEILIERGQRNSQSEFSSEIHPTGSEIKSGIYK